MVPNLENLINLCMRIDILTLPFSYDLLQLLLAHAPGKDLFAFKILLYLFAIFVFQLLIELVEIRK